MRFSWSKEAIEKLTWHALQGESAQQIAAGLGCHLRTVQDMLCELGLHGRQARKFWTAKERKIVRERYANEKTAKLAAELGRKESSVYVLAHKMGLTKSPEYLASADACRLRRGDNVGAAFRFKKGAVPRNKGLRRPGWAPGRMRETQFKKGERTGAAARNWKPLGTILPDDEGYLRIKVREHAPGEHSGFGNPKVWPLLHRYIWEQHKGPIPPGHAVVFKDGKRKRCEIDNLELITRAELMKRNTIHNRYSPELRSAIMMLGAVKRKVREHAKKLNDGSAQPSV